MLAHLSRLLVVRLVACSIDAPGTVMLHRSAHTSAADQGPCNTSWCGAQSKARQGLHGRRFSKGTVRASFFSEARYVGKDFQ